LSEQNSVSIKQFLGINESATETQLKPGEASRMVNFFISDDLKLKKMYGYEHLNTADAKSVRGAWYGSLNGVSHFLYAKNGHVYKHDLSTHADTDLGTIADSAPTNFFVSNNTVYIMDGTDLYSWNGTGSIATVTGYAPTIATASPPSGGGTLLEGINYLTGQKKQKFSADGSATVYQLAELDIDSVDTVEVDGETMTLTTDYAVNLTNGTVTFTPAPAEGVNNVVITWTKETSGDRQTITKNCYYGGVYYARFWIFGNPDHRNTRYCSGVTTAGVSDPSYWPKYTESDVGEHEITDIKIQYSKQIIFTSGDSSGATAWYSEEEDYIDPTTGAVMALFPVYPMNSKVGNVAKGQVQIIYNNPFTIHKGVYEWESTYVMDEKNAKWISSRVQPSLDEVDLTKAISLDWDDKGQYWLCVGKKVWVHNYRTRGLVENGVWYVLELAHAPTCFVVADGDLYFGTATGQIMKFSETAGTYDGTKIEADWEMGYFDFGNDWKVKFVQQGYISILPLVTTHVDVYCSTDRKASFRFIKTLSYALSSFETWDFSTFSFEVNYSPQPFKVRLREKKIDFLKLKLSNYDTDGVVVLSITLPFRQGGNIKNRS
jgi:hypothetical protein